MPDTRDTRLAALLLAWGILAHFHPTLDLPPEEWAAALHSALPDAAAAGDRESYRRAVLRLLARVDDPVASEYAHRDDPPFAWLPVEWEWVEGRLVITEPSGSVPEIRRGDVVLEVDGRPAGEAVAAMEALASAATPEARRWLALTYLNEGHPGTSVSLRLERPGAPTFSVTLRREQGNSTATDWLLPPVAEPRRGIVYVDLSRIDDAELERQLPRLVKAKGVVFDLRSSFPQVSTLVLSHLAPRLVDTLTWEVLVIQQPDRKGFQFLHSVTRLEPRSPRITGRVAFLADGRTFGNGERMLETVEAYHWGEIVGAASGGAVYTPNWSNLPGGWTVAWSGRRALKHDGKTLLNGTGIMPTIPVARTLRGIAEGRDEVVERAIEAVSR
jgi:C-terminal processing protease CtpA/Prc